MDKKGYHEVKREIEDDVNRLSVSTRDIVLNASLPKKFRELALKMNITLLEMIVYFDEN